MREIKLTRGMVATVDDDDYDRLSRHTWQWHDGYARRTVETPDGILHTVYMHREVMGITDQNIKVDHRNRNRSCNEKWNLRIGNNSQNMINSPSSCKNKTSQYNGVRRSGKKWQALIRKNYETIMIGRFDTEQEAALAYNMKALELFGEFAYLNKIGGKKQ